MHAHFNYSKQLLNRYKMDIRKSLPKEIPVAITCFVDFIIEHLYDETLTIEHANKACNIKSKSYSSRFSLFVGNTPKQYILLHRIASAKILLDETDLTVTQVSILVGFSTQSAFSKAFKNSTGGGKSICLE